MVEIILQDHHGFRALRAQRFQRFAYRLALHQREPQAVALRDGETQVAVHVVCPQRSGDIGGSLNHRQAAATTPGNDQGVFGLF
jgi:hypothetical protein